jgi:hypothetical protein
MLFFTQEGCPMSEYVAAALFVHTDDTKNLIKQLQNNASGTRITPVAFEALMRSPKARLEGVEHVVVAGSLEVIKEMMRLAFTICLKIRPTLSIWHCAGMTRSWI